MDYQLIKDSLPFLLKGAVVTINLSLASAFFGIILGIFSGLASLSKYKFIRIISRIYVEFMRGTPMIVQLFMFYFMLPSLVNFNISPFTAALCTCAINTGAYISEIFRGGIQSIDKGQTEAGESLGMNNFQIMYYVILPQTIKRILPSLCNEFIGLLKGTSIVSVIGMRELTREGQLIIARTYASFEIWMSVAVVYLVMTLTLSKLVTYLERRLQANDKR
jgi:polar amino acid transport system permease protein